MFESKNEKNVVEQTVEMEKNTVTGASVEDTPTTSTNNFEQPKDYLDSSLFDDIKVVSVDGDNKNKSYNEADQKVEERTPRNSWKRQHSHSAPS